MSEHRPEDNEGAENAVPEQPAPEQPAAEKTQPWGQEPPGGSAVYGQQPAVPDGGAQPWGQPAQPLGQQPPQLAVPQGQPLDPGQPQPNPYAYQPPQAQQPTQPWGQANDPYQQQFTGQQPPYGASYPQQPQPQAPWANQQPGAAWGPGDPNTAPYGAPYGQVPQKKRSLAWLWILLGVVAVAIIAVLWWISTLFAGPDSDRLYNQCAGGDPQACEELYQTSDAGSSDERFGETCGGRTDGTVECAEADMTSPANSWTGDANDDSAVQTGPAPLAIDDPNGCMLTACEEGAAFGDNSRLDNLYTACEGGNMDACDDLFLLSNVGSEYEEMGATCGEPGAVMPDYWCSPDTESRWQ